MLNQSDGRVEFVQRDFKVTDKVKAVRGHLTGLEGVVQKISVGQTFIVITIDMLGGAKVSINPLDLKPI